MLPTGSSHPPTLPPPLLSAYGTSDLRLVRIPAATHKPGEHRPVHYFSGPFPRLVDASRAPAYAPVAASDEPSVPLGYIDQVCGGGGSLLTSSDAPPSMLLGYILQCVWGAGAGAGE